MNKLILVQVSLLLTLLASRKDATPTAYFAPPVIPASTIVVNEPAIANLYRSWNLQAAGLCEEAFAQAMKGFQQLKDRHRLQKTGVLSIVDFSQPSSAKRLYIIDLKTGNLLFNALVAHGQQSGTARATRFSNKNASHQSSLGFYITQGTYIGSNGYSLKLQGVEKGLNNNALARAIVVHGADYVSEEFIRERGFLGRSHGCPALPRELTRPVINEIQGGSCLFIYHPSATYARHAQLLTRG